MRLHNAKYIITLSDDQRAQLRALVAQGIVSDRTRGHAEVLLRADCATGQPAQYDDEIADALRVSARTVRNVRERFVTKGMDAALYHASSSYQPKRKLDGTPLDALLALAASPPPAGRARWTHQLLADELVKQGVVEGVTRETVRKALMQRLVD